MADNQSQRAIYSHRGRGHFFRNGKKIWEPFQDSSLGAVISAITNLASYGGGAELDLHQLKDGSFVISHEPACIVKSGYKPLQKIAPEELKHTWERDRDRPILLSEVVAAMQYHQTATTLWELKELHVEQDYLYQISRCIQDAGLMDRVTVIGFEPFLRHLRYLAGEGIKVGVIAHPGFLVQRGGNYLRQGITTFLTGWTEGWQKRMFVPYMYLPFLARAVRRLHGRHMRVIAGVVNERIYMRRLARLGFDAIVTDKPAVALNHFQPIIAAKVSALETATTV
jgi:glycerophosphoryl diester phosphodiesterase